MHDVLAVAADTVQMLVMEICWKSGFSYVADLVVYAGLNYDLNCKQACQGSRQRWIGCR